MILMDNLKKTNLRLGNLTYASSIFFLVVGKERMAFLIGALVLRRTARLWERAEMETAVRPSLSARLHNRVREELGFQPSPSSFKLINITDYLVVVRA